MNFPLPILLVQHIIPSFMEGFATWLDKACVLSVALAKEGQMPAPGQVYVAPADHHLMFHAGRLHLDQGSPISSQRPSGTALFESLAREAGPQTIGVILTGMGDDGAEGLLKLKLAGGYTIAEEASTAVVYGMPGSAVKLGAVSESLPVHEIGSRLLELV